MRHPVAMRIAAGVAFRDQLVHLGKFHVHVHQHFVFKFTQAALDFFLDHQTDLGFGHAGRSRASETWLTVSALWTFVSGVLKLAHLILSKVFLCAGVWAAYGTKLVIVVTAPPVIVTSPNE